VIIMKKSFFGAMLGLGLIAGSLSATAIAEESKPVTAPSYETQGGELRCGINSSGAYCEIVIRW